MDGLKMPEKTGVSYASTTEYHHGCGHDGHVACLAAAGEFFIKNQ